MRSELTRLQLRFSSSSTIRTRHGSCALPAAMPPPPKLSPCTTLRLEYSRHWRLAPVMRAQREPHEIATCACAYRWVGCTVAYCVAQRVCAGQCQGYNGCTVCNEEIRPCLQSHAP